MKKIIILAAAAALALTACGGKNNADNTSSAAEGGPARQTSNQIAYVQLDSLMGKYTMFEELSAALQEKASKAEKELAAKGRNLERSMADAQEKIEKGLVTRAQAEELQVKLQRQEQSFYEYREKMQAELAEENQVMMNNLYNSINKFLAKYNADYRYSAIFATSSGTPILHADPLLDITEEVLKGLNEAYEIEKKEAE